jgi:hypothetical protein
LLWRAAAEELPCRLVGAVLVAFFLAFNHRSTKLLPSPSGPVALDHLQVVHGQPVTDQLLPSSAHRSTFPPSVVVLAAPMVRLAAAEVVVVAVAR